MTSTQYNRRKGATWESQCADLLNEEAVFGQRAGGVFRAPRWGAVDKGDLVNTGDFCIEAKNTKSLDLAQFMDETEVERLNAGRQFGVCFVKRRNRSTADGYAVMALGNFLELVKEFYEMRRELGRD